MKTMAQLSDAVNQTFPSRDQPNPYRPVNANSEKLLLSLSARVSAALLYWAPEYRGASQ
jgi:hypothetical protein